MLRNAVRSLCGEPRAANTPPRDRGDWLLPALLIPAALLEAIFRDDLGWPPVAFVLAAAAALVVPWRRSHPLFVVAVAFGLHAASEAVTVFGAEHSAMLYTSAWLVVLPYSLFRWGSGREAAIGLGITLVAHFPGGENAVRTIGEAVGATLFLLLPAALGAAVRFRVTAKLREKDHARSREREQLARELHDTVAHHVSAIVIQAQAGQAVAASDPGAAASVLRAIEAEASRTLAEMRFLVAALREGPRDAMLAPSRGVPDIVHLARTFGESPKVEVELSGGLDDLRPSVGAALYRLAQESITNAVRHARHATTVRVSVAGDEEFVRLTVHDDGAPSAFGAGSHLGYGLVGMAERAKLLGGTLDAGPCPSGGWLISTTLPRNGVPT